VGFLGSGHALRTRREASSDPSFPRTSVRHRFTTLALGLSAGVILLLAIDFLWQRQVFLKQIQGHICEEAQVIATALSQAATPEEKQADTDFLLHLLDDLDHYSVTHELYLLDPSGQVLFEGGADQSPWSGLTPRMREVLAGQAPMAFEMMWHGDRLVASCSVRGSVGLIHLSEPVPPLEAYWRYLIGHRLALAGLLTLLILGLVHLALARWIFHPLRRLLEGLRQARLDASQLAMPKEPIREWWEIAWAIEDSLQAVHRSHEALAEERARLAFLYRANHLLTEAEEWPLLTSIALRLAMEVADARSGVFLHHDPLTGRISLEHSEGLDPLMLEALWTYLSTKEGTLLCSSCQSRPGHLRLGCTLLPPHLQPEGPQGWLCMQLGYGGQPLGMVWLRQDPAAVIQPERWTLLEALAGEISAAVAAAYHALREASVIEEINHLVEQGRIPYRSIMRLIQQLTRACGMTSGALVIQKAGKGFPELLAHWGWLPGTTPSLLQAAQVFLRSNGSHNLDPSPIYQADLGWLHWVTIRLGRKAAGGLLLGHPTRARMLPSQRRLAQIVASQIALLLISMRRERELVEAVLWEERQRLARELHDSLAQQLAYLHLRIQKIERMANSCLPEEALVHSLREVREVLRDLYLEVRLTIEGFQAPHGKDLRDSLQQIIAPYIAREAFTVILELGDLPALSPWEEAHLLRIVQEALSNIRRHARARHVTIRTTWEEGAFVLTITDDGQGFVPQAVSPASMGLRAMQERAARIRGQLKIVSEPGQGTCVELRLPGRAPAIRGGAHAPNHSADR